MANRYFNQFLYSFLKKPVLLGGKVSLNSSAAVTGSDLKGCSITKTGTGEYTITLEDKYSKLFHASVIVADSAQDIVCDLKSINLTSKTMIVVTKVAGSAANVTDACDLYIGLTLSNSSVD